MYNRGMESNENHTRKGNKMKTELIRVTWNETYSASLGLTRYVDAGERTFHRQEDADRLVATLQDPNRPSIFEGREPKIEDLKMVTETIVLW